MVKTTFNERRPTPYTPPNKPHFNLHDSIKANPARPGGVQMLSDHMYANANYGFANPNDPANPNRRNAAAAGRGAARAIRCPGGAAGTVHCTAGAARGIRAPIAAARANRA